MSELYAPDGRSGASDKGNGETSPRAPALVLGIGASAGGVETLERFFDLMRPDSGIAFVVVQHLSPDVKSLMDEILSRHTAMPIHVASPGMRVLPNHVYLNPPGKLMGIEDGCLTFSERSELSTGHHPIDHFLTALAADAGRKSGALVLSGTGVDGSVGIGNIKRAGGLVLAQEPASAQFDGMPRAAVATGHVDVTLAPDQMPAMLESLVFQQGVHSEQVVGSTMGLAPILPLLHEAYGIDFGQYKVATLSRRTERRLLAVGSPDLREYAKRLHTDREELDKLYYDLLIGVTQFFRDQDAFEQVAAALMSDTLKRLEPGEEFRAWVAGCATGEEAYSLAMLVKECLEELDLTTPVKIFATDVHREALKHAALGIYDQAAISAMSADRRERFFVPRDDAWQVVQELRSMIVFAPHNALQDVPFNRLDLVSCRNLLIYLEPSAQRHVLSTFHFALKTRGLLFLGPSESLSDLAGAFDTVDTHWKLFRRRSDVRITPLASPIRAPVLRANPTAAPARVSSTPHDPSLLSTYQAMLDAVVAPSLLIGSRRNLVQTFGGASKYLHVPEGRVTDDIFEMVGVELRVALTGALGRVFNESQPIRYRGIRVADVGGTVLNITVRQVKGRRSSDAYALVTLEEQKAKESDVPPTDITSDQLTRDRIASLEEEVRHAKEDLQTTIEALEASNEELQATNEELMASNEELQTTNEELHSVNQELYTVNTEFQRKITELTTLTTDMDLLLASTEIHTLFLDKDLRVRRYTPRIGAVFNLTSADVGRRISAFNYSLSRRELYDDLRRVLATGELFEEQVQDERQAWYLLRILPYRKDLRIDGAVLTLVDISSMKRYETEARNKSDLLSNILTNSPHPVFVRDRDGAYVVADESFRKLAGRDPTGLKPDQVFSSEVAAILTRDDARILAQGITVEREEALPTPDGRRTYLSVSFPMRGTDSDEILGVGGILTDATSLKTAETEAREASERRDRFLATLSHELRNPLAAVLNAARIVTRATLTGAELDRWHKLILQRSLHMTRLVDDLLDVARLTQDKLALDRAPMDLVEAANGVLDEVRALFHARGITLETDFAAALPVFGDATRMHQLQVNLLTNAARHTPTGGVTRFSLRRDGGAAEISVADSGEGIPAHMLGRIFELFVQGDQPGSRGAEGGLGVGLALVRRIAELHGGSVSVGSHGRGKGAEFRVRVPLDLDRALNATRDFKAASTPGAISGPMGMRASAAAPIPMVTQSDTEPEYVVTQENLASANAATTSARPRTVLVVDDDESSRLAMSQLFELDDVQVTPAHDGETALALLESGLQPDLVLLDIGLPRMDGYEVCRRLRALPHGAGLIVFALTGFGQESDRAAAKAAGFDGHLTKPVDTEDVYALLAKHVR